MTELYIFSQNDQLLTIITEETGLVSAPVRIEVNSVPDTPFSFTVEADSENAEYVKDENKVVYRDHEGDLRLVVIKEIDDSDSIDGPLTTATCEPEFMELTEHIVVDRRFTDRTAQFMLDAALEGTRYIGEVEVELGVGSTNFYYLNSVEAIWKTIEVMGGEFKDVVEFNNNNNIIARKIKLLQRLGADIGQRFEIDHNITEIGRTVLSYPKTAMYGRGASLETEGGGNTRYIDFAEVEWKKSNGDPVDKPLGQRWVGDPDALQVYGRPHNGGRLHRYGIFSNQDYEDPEKLLWATWQNLQANKQPEVNYRLSVDLFDDKVSLGDTAIAIDRYFSRPIEIQARVIAMEYDLLDIEGTMVVEMGQFLNLDDDRLDELEDKIDKVASRPQRVTENSYPDRKPSRPVNVTAVGGFEVIQLYWDYADELFIKHYEVYGSQIADFVPDSQHLLWRGQVSAFAHAVSTDETWYYYVRAVNYHGTPSDWSVRVSASTTRIISDDILFGEIIADHLADNLDIADKLAQNTIDRINAGPMQAIQYTQKEIEATETRIIQDLNTRIGDVNASISDLLNRADGVDGTIIDINQEINTLDGKISTTITELSNLDGVVSEHTLTLNAIPGQLNAKAEKTEVYTKTEVDTAIDNINIADRNLVLNSDEFISNASYQIAEYSLSERMVEGVTYSISLKGNLPSGQDRWGIYLMSGAGTNLLINLRRDTEANGVYHGTFVGKEYNSSDSLRVYNMPQSTITENASIEWIKLVKGNKPSLDWTPAPEDTFEMINDKVDLTVYNNKVSELVVSIDGLSGRVKNTETSIDSITGDVDSALSQIGQLDVKADGIIADVSEISSDLEGTQSKLAQLEIKADEIVTTVTNIQIGGRNLIRDSFIPHTFNVAVNEFNYWIAYRGLERNATYTFSSKVEVLQGNVTHVTIYPYLSSSQQMSTIHLPIINGRVEGTFTTDGRYDYNFLIYNGKSGETQGNRIRLIEYQLEKGNKVTDWSPAPEDGIESMSQAESSITQLARDIKLKVDVDGVIASINLSKEGVRIDGNKHHITGQTLIDDAVIGTAAIANAAITKAKLGTAVIGTAQIENAAVTSAKIQSVAADKISAANLAAITADLGTVRAGRLLSNNNNLDANLNTGNITLRNANLTIANGASINFEDAGNTLTYRKYDSTDGFSRSAGIGVGDRIGGRYPFAYLGTNGAANLDSLSQYFSGFIANSTAATGSDNAANSVNGFIFQMRNRAVGWDKGITYDFNGSPTITMIGGQSYDYSIGALYQIRGKQAFNIINDFNSRSGWFLETNYAGNGTDITFRGQYGADYNYQIGGNSSTHAIRNIYLRNNPTVVSDRRAKEDIADNPLGLDFIKSFDTRVFRLKQKPSENERNKSQFGFIAQELIDSLNSFGVDIDDHTIIGVGDDGLYNLKETQLIAPTIRAVQELDQKLENELTWLKTENQLQANEIKILKNRVEKLEELVA